MIHIQKQNEPPLLKQYKKTKEKQGEVGTYSDFKEGEEGRKRFKELREALLEEQKYICCYCLQRIPEPLSRSAKNYKQDKDKLDLDKMKTEHFLPQSQYPSKDLDYHNLLAACKGNSDTSDKDNHCDSKKDKNELKYIPNPALGRKKDFKRIFKYDVNFKKNENYPAHQKEGEVLVSADDENINQEINNILNLNEQNLRYKRFRVIAPIIDRIEQKGQNPKHIKNIIDFYKETDNQNKLRSFCDFVVYWLEKRFKKELEAIS